MPITITQPNGNSTITTFPEETPRGEAADRSFRIRRIFILLGLVVAWFAILPFYPADLDYYAGGLEAGIYPRNHLGQLGAYFGWGLFVTLGLSAYVLLGTALVCSLRRLVWRGKLRRSSWEYYLAIIFFTLGCSLLLGLFPNAFSSLTAKLNISQLPGGIIGQYLCAPGSGMFFVLMSYAGCLFIAVPMILISLGVLWIYDWAELFQAGMSYLQQARAAENPVSAPVEPPSPQAPDALYGTPTTPVPMPVPPSQPAVRTNFQGRRASLQGIPAPQTFEPVAPKATPKQPELPIHQTVAPQIQSPKPATAPQPTPSSGGAYQLPGLNLFRPPANDNLSVSAEEIQSRAEIIQRTLDEFNVDATVINAIPGPQITLFEVEMGTGKRPEDICRAQSAMGMNLELQMAPRMLTPIPGRKYAGVEIPNKKLITVTAYELFASQIWQDNRMNIPLMLGKNINGQPIVIDLAKAPHLLVAGSTGSGKSVTMNMMIQSMLMRFTPDDLKLIMFDPKYLEFAAYSTIPHLLSPVINEPEQVSTVLQWAINEMNRRYRQMTAARVKKIQEFNARPNSEQELFTSEGEEVPRKLPYIVIIIDELADIMAHAQKEVDRALSILAGKARAAGIHMIIATQRPDAKIITGVVKANFPWRIALRVTDSTNSRIIINKMGAEMLLGMGDMLLLSDRPEPERIQSGFASNDEIAAMVNFISAQAQPNFDPSIQAAIEAQKASSAGRDGAGGTSDDMPPGEFASEGTDLVSRALEALLTTRKPTISNLQRRLGIGYNRAATLMEELEDLGYVGPQPSSGMREIYWDAFPTAGSASNFNPNDDQEDA